MVKKNLSSSSSTTSSAFPTEYYRDKQVSFLANGYGVVLDREANQFQIIDIEAKNVVYTIAVKQADEITAYHVLPNDNIVLTRESDGINNEAYKRIEVIDSSLASKTCGKTLVSAKYGYDISEVDTIDVISDRFIAIRHGMGPHYMVADLQSHHHMYQAAYPGYLYEITGLPDEKVAIRSESNTSVIDARTREYVIRGLPENLKFVDSEMGIHLEKSQHGLSLFLYRDEEHPAINLVRSLPEGSQCMVLDSRHLIIYDEHSVRLYELQSDNGKAVMLDEQRLASLLPDDKRDSIGHWQRKPLISRCRLWLENLSAPKLTTTEEKVIQEACDTHLNHLLNKVDTKVRERIECKAEGEGITLKTRSGQLLNLSLLEPADFKDKPYNFKKVQAVLRLLQLLKTHNKTAVAQYISDTHNGRDYPFNKIINQHGTVHSIFGMKQSSESGDFYKKLVSIVASFDKPPLAEKPLR